jgi:hypothetical protein
MGGILFLITATAALGGDYASKKGKHQQQRKKWKKKAVKKLDFIKNILFHNFGQ